MTAEAAVQQDLTIDTAALLENIPRARLERMHAAGMTILESYRALEKAGRNVVGQCLAHQGTFYELEHYPRGDVFDEEFGAQYYYHAHRPESGEHGHFHCFLRREGMPVGAHPVKMPPDTPRPVGEDAICHLIAISMDPMGYPTHLFTTNRWVTNETFYPADQALEMVDRFRVDHAWPCLATNNWITAMLQLFWPQIRLLLNERDRVIADWARRHPDVNVYEDRELEITSIMPIDVDDQISQVERALTAVR